MTVTITEGQAAMLRNLVAARDAASRDIDIALTAIVAGHGVHTVVTRFDLNGTTLTLEGPHE